MFLLSQLLREICTSLSAKMFCGEFCWSFIPCNWFRVIFHTLLIGSHTSTLSQRNKILYTFLVQSADSGCSLSTSCERQIALSCCLQTSEPKIGSRHPLDHGHSSESCLVPFEKDRLLRDQAKLSHHFEKQF